MNNHHGTTTTAREQRRMRPHRQKYYISIFFSADKKYMRKKRFSITKVDFSSLVSSFVCATNQRAASHCRWHSTQTHIRVALMNELEHREQTIYT